jgi:hypothetical protein
VRIDELASKHALSIPGFDLIHFSEVAFPVWKVNLNLLMLKEIPLNVVDEFILKLVEVGVGQIEELSNTLGIKEEIIKNSSISLMRNDILRFSQKTKTLVLTDKGVEALEAIKIVVPEERSYSYYVDGITGAYCSIEGHSLYPPQSIKQLGLRSIHPSKNVSIPSDETIDFNRLESLLKGMSNKGQTSAPRGRMIEINSVEKVYMMYAKMRVLVFYNFKNKKYQYMVFDRSFRANEFDGILLSADFEEQLGVLPLEKVEDINGSSISEQITSLLFDKATNNTEELRKLENKLHQLANGSDSKKSSMPNEVEIIKESLEELKRTTRLIKKFEYRNALELGLDTSKEWVIMLNPFISNGTFDNDILARIDKTLQRGCKVFFLYGILNKSNYSVGKEEKNILAEIKKIKGKKHGKFLFIKEIENTYEKILISDTNFMIMGKYSWLESDFKSSQGLRIENNVYTEETKIIKETIEEIKVLAKIKSEDLSVTVKTSKKKEIKVFFSYSHKDENLRDELEKHLIMLKRKGIISTWHDRKIDAGEILDTEIDENIESADIILLLISIDFLASNYCYEIEMKLALEKDRRKEAKVIPVILRECDWHSAPFSNKNALPTDGKCVTSWNDQDAAFLNITKGIEKIVTKIG